ncbi:hypothetical protein, partial [Parachitinimonas caeni]
MLDLSYLYDEPQVKLASQNNPDNPELYFSLTPNRGPNLPTAKPLYGKLRLGKSPVVMIDPQFQRPEAP